MKISDELRTYLTATARVAKVATIRKAGTPWVQPVWFTLDGDDPILVIGGETLLGRTLRRSPHLALCVDDDDPYGFATLEGRVEFFDDPAGARGWTRKMVLHYKPGVDDVEAYLDDLLGDSAVLYRMEVTRVVFRPTLE